MKSNALLLVLLCLVLQSPAHAQMRPWEKKSPAPVAIRKFTDEERKLLDQAEKQVKQAIALSEQGKHAEAAKEFRAVLAIRQRVLGTEHSDTLNSRHNLALVLYAHGKYREAEKEHRECIVIEERVLGAEHSDVFMSCFCLAKCLEAQEKLSEALIFMQRAESGWQKTLGADHPNTTGAKLMRGRIEAEMKAGK